MALNILKEHYPDPIDVRGFESSWFHDLRDKANDDYWEGPPWELYDLKFYVRHYIKHRDEKSKLKGAKVRLDNLVKNGYVEKLPPKSNSLYASMYRLKDEKAAILRILDCKYEDIL